MKSNYQLQHIQHEYNNPSNPEDSKENPTKLLNSNILDDNGVQFARESLEGKSYKIKEAKLLYRASENGFCALKFHEKCDNIKNTLTIIRTQFKRTIAGYTPLQWNQIGNGPDFKADHSKRSFLLQFELKQKIQIVQPQKAIYCHNNYGPTFGASSDIHICDDAHLNPSTANFPGSYNYRPKPYNNNQLSYTAFSGAKKDHAFKVVQYQVYQIIYHPSVQELLISKQNIKKQLQKKTLQLQLMKSQLQKLKQSQLKRKSQNYEQQKEVDILQEKYQPENQISKQGQAAQIDNGKQQLQKFKQEYQKTKQELNLVKKSQKNLKQNIEQLKLSLQKKQQQLDLYKQNKQKAKPQLNEIQKTQQMKKERENNLVKLKEQQEKCGCAIM